MNVLSADADVLAIPETSAADPLPADRAWFEFEIAETELPRLLRHPALQAVRAGAIRTGSLNVVWHDTADGSLAAEGVTIGQLTGRSLGPSLGPTPPRIGIWRLERLSPGADDGWLPGRAAPVLAEAPTPEALGWRLPGPLAPAAALQARTRTLPLLLPTGPAELTLLTGTLRGVVHDQPVCRLRLSGDARDCATLAIGLAGVLRLSVPTRSLAASGLAWARGCKPPTPRNSPPAIPPGLSVGDAITLVLAHLAGVALRCATEIHDAAGVDSAGAHALGPNLPGPNLPSPEAVHQMRVAVRRLRSALSVFRRAAEDSQADCLWLDELAATLRHLAARLGVARDWDVFVTETGAEVQSAFPPDSRVDRLLAAAGRKRQTAYAELHAYFASQDWIRLAMQLAMLPSLQPWLEAPAAGQPARAYAAQALSRRLKQVLSSGADVAHLAPAQLHVIRKQAKRLRYATEFFAPLFAEKPVRKYLPRLASLQQALGVVNDMDVAASLARQLEGGADRAFAAGVIQGFGAARAARAAGRVQRVWDRFHRADPFWD